MALEDTPWVRSYEEHFDDLDALIVYQLRCVVECTWRAVCSNLYDIKGKPEWMMRDNVVYMYGPYLCGHQVAGAELCGWAEHRLGWEVD